jgi:hypothetical protein
MTSVPRQDAWAVPGNGILGGLKADRNSSSAGESDELDESPWAQGLREMRARRMADDYNPGE